LPIYTYRCKSCGHELEEMQPMGSGPPGPCPECGGKLKKTYGHVGVRFSGWGFSKTDSLAPGDRPRKDFRKLKDKAEEIAEGD
jgi:putative FmdB family regulatory protein